MSLTQFSDAFISSSFNSEHYELLHKIGEGGFGKVFKAKHKNTNQLVAIKFLAIEPHCEEQKKQRYIERFKRETELSSQLQHPHIVRLLDRGQVNDCILYGVFEYVEGVTLREYLTTEHALDSVTATDVMLQILDALIHAHSKGIIHRDIKPANIMLTKMGAKTYAKILDFGIGTLVQDTRAVDYHTLTLTQETLGTPSYSAPEQLRGEPASAKSDLYVWGLVYLECLTGLPAVSGNSIASIYHKQLSDVHIPIPSALLGHPIAELLRRVLHKNATERVITGAEVYAELSTINVSNLVGVLADASAKHGFDDTTVMIRDDDPNHRAIADYTALTERKQLTVLAVRLSVKALNNNDKDYDVIDAVYKSQRNHLIDIATRYGAYHVGNLADTCLFYFGYPIASDNDTRLCARTALEMVGELTKRNALMQEAHGVAINAHVGIHTGVFITYANAVPEGHNANIAIALSREAGEKQILCTFESRSILDAYSEFKTYGQVQLGPIFEPVTIFNLMGERRVEAFGFMRGTRNHHELIGRHTELEQTLSIFNAHNEQTRMAHIHGEAGIGKSRLLQEIRANAPQYQHLVAQCLPEHQNNALYPILTLIRYLYNTPNLDVDSASTLFSKLLETQNSELNIVQTLPILLVWLNIDLGDKLQPSALAPDAQKELLFESLSALLLSSQYNLNDFKLYIVEDIHWADSSTLEFLHHFAQKLTQGHVLLSTSRQNIPSQLHDLTLLDINLKKLTEQATEDFIVKLFDGRNVARNVLDVLVSRTDGIPLFIEELVGMLKQKGLVADSANNIDFVNPDKLDQVPTSLRESLQQKLDSLQYAKETAQLAATIGREFEYDLLVAASPLSENQIQNDLKELMESDLIIHQRRVDNDSYIFKHALIKDTAYESILPDKKLELHSTIGDTLSFGKVNFSESSSLISRHYLLANRHNDSVKASLLILKHKSFINDFKGFNDLLEQVQYVNSKVINQKEQIANSILVSSITLKSKSSQLGYGHHCIREIALKSLWESRRLGSISDKEINTSIFISKWFLMLYHHMNNNKVLTTKYSYELIAKNEDIETIYVHIVLAKSMLLQGKVKNAEKHINKAFWILDNFKDIKSNDLSFGISYKPMLYMISALLSAFKSDFHRAFEHIDKAISIGREKRDHNAVAQSCCYACFICLMHHENGTSQKTKARLYINLANEHFEKYGSLEYVLPCLELLNGWVNNNTKIIEKWIYNPVYMSGIMYSLWISFYLSTKKINPIYIEEKIKKAEEIGEKFFQPILYKMIDSRPKCEIDFYIENENTWALEVMNSEL
ncbi:TOMM system kinase/cyclase fusion protein [Pseudoalteromonas sp. JBTF-M23]|uniref:TOMM system kinase/cyclase fusion protein n=1 Tax=Pseudoalteromonas caenipelagi TaxID=2726988 RepID=A0A849VB94_9GAMM|nr:TOMM system kinase/cyclase fusion protein [Pseudoalteromonas caenipelagi]NOU49863.1 TOMM system kinase/cyclase fusion protein [Pseudoalteromonas caenipelagi]